MTKCKCRSEAISFLVKIVRYIWIQRNQITKPVQIHLICLKRVQEIVKRRTMVSLAVLGLCMTIGFHIADGDIFHHKVGGTITLPCKNVVYPNCSSTTWNFKSTELVAFGVIKNNSDRTQRLSVGVNCSLVVHNLTPEDAGLYTCRQYLSRIGAQHGDDAPVHLYVQPNEIASATPTSPEIKGHSTPLSNTSTPWTVNAAAVSGAIGAVILCLLAVIIIIIIIIKNRAKNRKSTNDTLALTTDIVRNSMGNQQTPPTYEDKDGHDDGPTYAVIYHHSKNKAAPTPQIRQEDMVTYASVNCS